MDAIMRTHCQADINVPETFILLQEQQQAWYSCA